jgi:hypothetical protein
MWYAARLHGCHVRFRAGQHPAALLHLVSTPAQNINANPVDATAEIDTSTYAIPRPHQITEWLAVVSKGFMFHIKAFGLFPSRSVTVGALPRA